MKNRLAKVKEYAQAAIETLLVTRGKFALLEPLMKNEALAKRFSKGLRPNARYIMISTVYLDCSLSLLAISVDCGKRVASVCIILCLLKSDDLRNRLRDEFLKTNAYVWDLENLPEESSEPTDQKYTAQDRARAQCQFDETYEKVRQQFDVLKQGEVCVRLKKVRDKVHAHKEMVSENGKPPRLRRLDEFEIQVGDLETFLSSIEELLLELARLTGNSQYLGFFKEESKTMAKQFWGLDESSD